MKPANATRIGQAFQRRAEEVEAQLAQTRKNSPKRRQLQDEARILTFLLSDPSITKADQLEEARA